MVEDDPEIEAIFRREARTRVDGLRATLEGDDADAHYALFRHAHSLKGIASMTGHERVAALAERLVGRVRDAQGNPRTPDDAEAVRDDVARLTDELARLERQA